MSETMKGKTVVVTGANTGIGLETARELARRGARVLVCARDEAKGQRAVDDLRHSTKNQDVELQLLDLASLADVRRAAAELLGRCPRLDVLINNAGLILTDRRETADGFEATLGTNHLGPFLLTNLLLDRLCESAPARIVNLSSSAHYQARRGLDFDDLHFRQTPYSGWTAYARSKLANIYFTVELARRLAGSGVTANAVHPGVIRTGFGKDGDTGKLFNALLVLGGPFLGSPQRGARTSLHVATAPELATVSGKFFARSKEKRPSKVALDAEAARRLWQISAREVGLPSD